MRSVLHRVYHGRQSTLTLEEIRGQLEFASYIDDPLQGGSGKFETLCLRYVDCPDIWPLLPARFRAKSAFSTSEGARLHGIRERNRREEVRA